MSVWVGSCKPRVDGEARARIELVNLAGSVDCVESIQERCRRNLR